MLPPQFNPMTDVRDDRGDRCALGQRERVWFLAGSWHGVRAERRCHLPTGTLIFLPVYEATWVQDAYDAEQPALAEVHARLARLVSGAQLSFELDGVAVQHLDHYRVRSAAGRSVIPPANIFGEPAIARDLSRFLVVDGYFLMLAPLSIGPHRLRIHAEISREDVRVDVVYHLEVGPPTALRFGLPPGVSSAAGPRPAPFTEADP